MDDDGCSAPLITSIPLSHAVLCADCEVISDSSGEVCEVCGSRSLLNLGRVLGGCIGAERAVMVPLDEAEMRRLFTLFVNPDRVGTTARPQQPESPMLDESAG